MRDLRSLCGDGLSVVVAVSPDRLAEVGDLQRAGADEIVPWEGRPDPVAWAIERALAVRQDATPPPLPPAPERAAVPPPLAARDAPPAATPAPVEPPVPGGPTWPAGVPAGPEAEVRLVALALGPPGEPRWSASGPAHLPSALEGDALAGRPVPIEPGLVRRVAVLRYRVALALESAPAPGAAYDHAAVQSLLGEIDAVLAGLRASGEALPAEALPPFEALRNALVADAVDFTDAVQRIAPAGTEPSAAAQAVARRAERKVGAIRVDALPEARAPVRRRVLPALVVLSALAAAGYHGWQGFRPRPAPLGAAVSGAPAGMIAAGGPAQPRTLVDPRGKMPPPAELKRFREEQALRRHEVIEVGRGALLVVPRGSMQPAIEGDEP